MPCTMSVCSSGSERSPRTVPRTRVNRQAVFCSRVSRYQSEWAHEGEDGHTRVRRNGIPECEDTCYWGTTDPLRFFGVAGLRTAEASNSSARSTKAFDAVEDLYCIQTGVTDVDELLNLQTPHPLFWLIP